VSDEEDDGRTDTEEQAEAIRIVPMPVPLVIEVEGGDHDPVPPPTDATATVFTGMVVGEPADTTEMAAVAIAAGDDGDQPPEGLDQDQDYEDEPSGRKELPAEPPALDPIQTDFERRWTTPRALAVVALAVVAAVGALVAAVVMPNKGDNAASADGAHQRSASASAAAAASSTTSSTTQATTTTTSTTVATTTTKAPVTIPPTVATRPPTTRPPTTTTTATPGPVIDSFSFDISPRQGGPGRCNWDKRYVTFRWNTSRATSVTLGVAGQGSGGVGLDGQTSACVSNFGATWRLTATGPGGTVSRDASVPPGF
jgi:hypothetical protein